MYRIYLCRYIRWHTRTTSKWGERVFGNGKLKEARRRIPIVYLRFHKLYACISMPLIRVELSDLSFGFIEARWISHGRSGRAVTRTRLSRENPLILASARNLNESFVGKCQKLFPSRPCNLAAVSVWYQIFNYSSWKSSDLNNSKVKKESSFSVFCYVFYLLSLI